MGLQCGIVGLPNVGKSTLFNALTQANVSAANYAFCTIEPNIGVVPVPDNRLEELAKIVHPQKIQPATVEFVDIAGLVGGASKGEGLGNQFLGTIRNTDAIIHVVRCFEDPNVVHVANKIDPISDIDTIYLELILSDLASLNKALAQKKHYLEKSNEHVILQKAKKYLEETRLLNEIPWHDEERKELKNFGFLTLKPLLYVANIAENGSTNNALLEKLTQKADEEKRPLVTICATLESEIAHLNDPDKSAFLKAMNLNEPGLNRLIRKAYKLLKLQTYFTAGPKEVRAWTIPMSYTAPQAAGVIHTDFEKGFIRAQTIDWKDFIRFKGEQGARENGKMRIEGKDYIVKDGDVMHFLFNV